MKIAIFTEGTILMHKNATGHSRNEIVQQVVSRDPSVKNYSTYIQIFGAVEKANSWINKDAEIIYITSRKDQKEIDEIQKVLDKNNFPKGLLEYRKVNEKYKDVIERIIPDVLIEDDCESIGGIKKMAITFIEPEIKSKIKSIVIKEFQGIDHLPDDINSLLMNK